MSTGSRWSAPVWFAVAMGVVVAGCGGEEVSMEEFTAEANAICEEHQNNIEAAASDVLEGGEPPGPEQFGQLVQGTIVPELSTQFERLGDVEPPEEVAEAYEAYVDEGTQVVEQAQENPAAIADPANVAEVNEQADAAGLSDACHLGPA